VYITSHNRIKPNCTPVAHRYLTHHHSAISHKAIFTKMWLKTSYFFDDTHVSLFLF
jgi:hypothetical protein